MEINKKELDVITDGVKGMMTDRDNMQTELNDLKQKLADIETKAERRGGSSVDKEAEAKTQRKSLITAFLRKGRNADELVDFAKDFAREKQVDYAANFNTIEEEMSRSILEYAIDNTAFLMDMSSYMVGSVEHRRPILDPATRPTVEQTGENNSPPGTNPADTTTQQYIFVRAQFAKIYAMPALTHEMLLDSHLDLEAELLRLIAEEWALKLQQMIMFGNGDATGNTVNLRGFLNFRIDAESQIGGGVAYAEARLADNVRSPECFQIAPSGTNGVFGTDYTEIQDYFIDVQISLHHKYTMGAKWYFNRRTFAQLKKVRDAEGRALIEWGQLSRTADAEGMGYMLLGSPIVICDALPDSNPSAAAVVGLYGDIGRAQSIIPLAGSEHTIIDEITRKGQKLIYRDMRIGEIVGNHESVRVLFQGA